MNLRLPLNTCDQELIQEECSPSPSGSSSQNTLSTQSDTFDWPDVQELRIKYASQSSKVTHSCTAPNGMLACRTNTCNGCSHKYSSSFELHRAVTESHRTEAADEERSSMEEDSPQPKLPPLLCRWSSLDHMLGSLPLHEIQNLQEPVRTTHTGSQVCLVTRETGRPHDEGSDCATKSKMAESNFVKSLREKFQSLSASS